VAIGIDPQEITSYLEQHPSSTYEPKIDPSISVDPIVTAKTQPLPNFGLDASFVNIHVVLADYSQGEISVENFDWFV